MYLDDDDTIVVTSNVTPTAVTTSALHTRSPQVNANQNFQAQLDEHSKQIRRLEDALVSTKRELALQSGRNDAPDPGRLHSQPEHRRDSNVANFDITGVKGSFFKTRFFGLSCWSSSFSFLFPFLPFSKHILNPFPSGIPRSEKSTVSHPTPHRIIEGDRAREPCPQGKSVRHQGCCYLRPTTANFKTC